MRPTDLQLDLDAYAGPFDLLCTLLLRRELGVDDLDLVEVVVGYVQRLDQLDQVDPNTASEFILLLASLMEVKARELLNYEADLDIEEPGAVEAQADMLERLKRYTTFRNAAAWLRDTTADHRWWRVASRPVVRTKKTYDGPVLDPQILQRSMNVLLAQPNVDIRHLVGKHASVHEMTGRLLGMVRKKRSVSLDDAVEGLSRLDQAVAFVAALELCKNGRVQLCQSEQFGPIELREQHQSAQEDDSDVASEEARDMGMQTA